MDTSMKKFDSEINRILARKIKARRKQKALEQEYPAKTETSPAIRGDRNTKSTEYANSPA